MLLLTRLLAVIMKFLFCAPAFLASPPPPPLQMFALNLPRRLAAAADVLLGMITTDLLLLLLQQFLKAYCCMDLTQTQGKKMLCYTATSSTGYPLSSTAASLQSALHLMLPPS
jgi:hypothetical protein